MHRIFRSIICVCEPVLLCMFVMDVTLYYLFVFLQFIKELHMFCYLLIPQFFFSSIILIILHFFILETCALEI